MIDFVMIVNCMVYKKGKKLCDISFDEISDVLEEEGIFVWLGLLEFNVELMNKIKEEFCLYELVVEDVYVVYQWFKIEEYGDIFFVVLYMVQLVGGEVLFGEIYILIGLCFVVMVWYGVLCSYVKVCEYCEMLFECLVCGFSFVLYFIMDFVVDNYCFIMDDFEIKFSQYEEQFFNFGVFSGKVYLQELYQLKCQLICLCLVVMLLLDVCIQLLCFYEGLIIKEGKVYFCDIYDYVVCFIDIGDCLWEMVELVVQINLVQVIIYQNEIVQILVGWGVILVILIMIFSFYGMNFVYMLGLFW